MWFKVLLFSCVPLSLFAQKEPSKEDYLVFNTTDTLYGTIILKKNEQISSKPDKKITLLDTRGKKKKYSTDAITAFCVDNTIFEEFWLSVFFEGPFSLNSQYKIDKKKGDKFFLKVIEKGALSHYALEWQEQGESLVFSMDLLKKEEDDFLIRATQGLLGLKRRVLVEYFKSCPALVDRLKHKDLSDIAQIVAYYNKNCFSKM